MAYNRVLVIQEVDVAYRTARASNSNGVSELRTGESLEAPKGPYSNSGFKTGACQIARSSFEIPRFAEIELWPGFEIGEAVP